MKIQIPKVLLGTTIALAALCAKGAVVELRTDPANKQYHYRVTMKLDGGTYFNASCSLCRNPNLTGCGAGQEKFKISVTPGVYANEIGNSAWNVVGVGTITLDAVCGVAPGFYLGAALYADYGSNLTDVTVTGDINDYVARLPNRSRWYSSDRIQYESSTRYLRIHVADRITMKGNSTTTVIDRVEGDGRAFINFDYKSLPSNFRCGADQVGRTDSILKPGDRMMCSYSGSSPGTIVGELGVDLTVL